jgi:hypothetical protein
MLAEKNDPPPLATLQLGAIRALSQTVEATGNRLWLDSRTVDTEQAQALRDFAAKAIESVACIARAGIEETPAALQRLDLALAAQSLDEFLSGHRLGLRSVPCDDVVSWLRDVAREGERADEAETRLTPFAAFTLEVIHALAQTVAAIASLLASSGRHTAPQGQLTQLSIRLADRIEHIAQYALEGLAERHQRRYIIADLEMLSFALQTSRAIIAGGGRDLPSDEQISRLLEQAVTCREPIVSAG